VGETLTKSDGWIRIRIRARSKELARALSIIRNHDVYDWQASIYRGSISDSLPMDYWSTTFFMSASYLFEGSQISTVLSCSIFVCALLLDYFLDGAFVRLFDCLIYVRSMRSYLRQSVAVCSYRDSE
jgi:hypothetical protein